LPIADGGILYVEPMYTERKTTSPNSSTFPQLSRVLVSYREPPPSNSVRVGYAPTLAEALDQVFGAGTGSAATAPSPDADPQPQEPTPPPAEAGVPAPAPTPAPAPPSGDEAAVVAELDASLQALETAQRSGDFAAYGEALDRVQKAVAAYQQLPR